MFYLQFASLLNYIQEHEHQYPRIFRLAMDIIPIQASSVPCERVFSSGKETMAPRRRRISAKLMEALQMLKYSIKKGHPLNFTQGMRWTDELTEFEFAARTEPVGDAEAYGCSLGEPEMDLDVIDEDLDDLQKDLEALEQLLSGSDDEEEEEEEEEEDDE
jgi:hAT family C-terminal dimerisation region